MSYCQKCEKLLTCVEQIQHMDRIKPFFDIDCGHKCCSQKCLEAHLKDCFCVFLLRLKTLEKKYFDKSMTTKSQQELIEKINAIIK